MGNGLQADIARRVSSTLGASNGTQRGFCLPTGRSSDYLPDTSCSDRRVQRRGRRHSGQNGHYLSQYQPVQRHQDVERENCPLSWKKKRRWRNLHHLTPRSRNGNHTRANLLLIHEDRHVEWHRVFGNLTLEEVIELLLRVQRAKQRQVA